MKNKARKPPNGGKKVFVGMSGGVDSSVSAALLQRAGYDVTGVFIKVWQADFLPCDWRAERLDAMRVAAKLGIPFLTVDFEEEYKREVVDYMIAEYKAGRTPNPDVMCNRHVKFGAFWHEAQKRGADFIATGHYAQIGSAADRKYKLQVSTDTEKDQTYFLWTLIQEDLAHSLFPVGGMKKKQVRALAEKFGLPTAEKKDSQGLCFIGHVDMKDFLAHYLKPKSGKVLDESGRAIGIHDGAYFYTIGQRHGFVVHKKTAADRPLYIVSKDVAKNTVTVAERPIVIEKSKPSLSLSLSRSITIDSVVWNNKDSAKRLIGTGAKCTARIRYRQPLQECVVKKCTVGKAEKRSKKNGEGYKKSAAKLIVIFEQPQEAVSAGQSLVFYSADGKQCFGGGVIAV